MAAFPPSFLLFPMWGLCPRDLWSSAQYLALSLVACWLHGEWFAPQTTLISFVFLPFHHKEPIASNCELSSMEKQRQSWNEAKLSMSLWEDMSLSLRIQRNINFKFVLIGFFLFLSYWCLNPNSSITLIRLSYFLDLICLWISILTWQVSVVPTFLNSPWVNVSYFLLFSNN